MTSCIRATPHHIHLQKVKAHTGVPGNESADEAARHMPRAIPSTAPMTCLTATLTRNPHHRLSSGQYRLVPMMPSNNNDAVRQARQHIGDLGKDFKKYLHEKHRIGYSNMPSAYSGMGKDSNNCTQRPQQYANAKQPGGRLQDRRTTLQMLQISWPQHSQSTKPYEICTHTQLSPVRATRWGTSLYEWMPTHE
jgi:hypothetical protein